MTLDEYTEFVKKTAGMIVAGGEEHQPFIFAINSNNDIAVINLRDIDKNIFKPCVSKILQLFSARSYVMVNEGWSTHLPISSPTIKRISNGEISVRELPPDDKCEILMVTAVENGKSYRSWQAKIRYTPEGARYLDKWEELPQVFQGKLVLKEW